MKRTMKKHLSLLLAVLMLMSSVVFNIAAADHTHQIEPSNPKYFETVNPTCTEMGYTIYYCSLCDGKYEVSRGDYKEPLGHQYGEWQYVHISEVDNSGVDGYYKYQACTRTFVGKDACGERVYETENGAKTVYYLVKFVHNKIAASYDKDITYTKVAASYTSKELYSCYVKSGTAAYYEGEVYPYREKTKEFGEYSYIGWSEKALEATKAQNLSAADCMDLSSITKNLTVYPVFEGVNVYHDVTFYSLKGQITKPQAVLHGDAPLYRVNGDSSNAYYDDPTKDEDLINTYEFNGWAPNSINQPSGVPTKPADNVLGVEETPVYGDIHYYPTFKPVAKDYTVEFYDHSGTKLLKYVVNEETKEAVFTNVHLLTNLFDKNVYAGAEGINKLNNNPLSTAKDSDKIYDYIWTGWRVLREDDSYGSTVNLGNFNITEGDFFLDGEGNRVIRLVPAYERRLRVYVVDIEMQIPTGEDKDYYRGDAVVHVVANNNQLVASGKTDGKGKFRCYLNYQCPFTVTIATHDSKYLGNATISDLEKVMSSDEAEAEANKCLVAMSLNPEYETHCSCIHHNALLQPIFVRILNLLYTFFNVKYVCCYDMYSTIGPLLDYTKD